jgi:hypothetical protein
MQSLRNARICHATATSRVDPGKPGGACVWVGGWLRGPSVSDHRVSLDHPCIWLFFWAYYTFLEQPIQLFGWSDMYARRLRWSDNIQQRTLALGSRVIFRVIDVFLLPPASDDGRCIVYLLLV